MINEPPGNFTFRIGLFGGVAAHKLHPVATRSLNAPGLYSTHTLRKLLVAGFFNT
jgi:hypothetical protein